MKTLLKNATLVDEHSVKELDVLIEGERIIKIDGDISGESADSILDIEGKHLFPGVIDDQVHFREPGLTQKANIYTESRAAVAGGITSFMEMPNTVPNAVTQALLEDKYDIGKNTSLANYSFFMGATNDNLEEVLKTDANNVCGIKVFMGSSTGNMLVDNAKTLEGIFSSTDMLIATHCEDEATIQANLALYKEKYGNDIPMRAHPLIRSEAACYLSSSMAAELAKKHNSRLHILHISTAKETGLFDNKVALKDKKITAEACIHHMWFNDSYYDSKGALIKWNPAVKTEADRTAIFEAVLNDKIDVIATDHAPHTAEEKNNGYLTAPSGGPLVQHSLVAMLDFYHQGKIPLTKIIEKMCHNPAILFNIQDRGFIKEGYYADMVVANLNNPWTVAPDNILYKCGWSPFEGHEFKSSIEKTFVSGHLAYDQGKFDASKNGLRLKFNNR